MQLHLGTNASGGVSAHSSSYSLSMRSPRSGGPRVAPGSGQETSTQAKTPQSSAGALGALYNGGGGGGGGGGRQAAEEEAGGGRRGRPDRASGSSCSSTRCAGVTCGQRASRELRAPGSAGPAPPPAPPPPPAVPGGAINAEPGPGRRRSRKGQAEHGRRRVAAPPTAPSPAGAPFIFS